MARLGSEAPVVGVLLLLIGAVQRLVTAVRQRVLFVAETATTLTNRLESRVASTSGGASGTRMNSLRGLNRSSNGIWSFVAGIGCRAERTNLILVRKGWARLKLNLSRGVSS